MGDLFPPLWQGEEIRWLGSLQAAPIKEVTASTTLTTFLGRRHEELGFRIATLIEAGMVLCRGIIFSNHFSVLS
jgi:hypothetical protein